MWRRYRWWIAAAVAALAAASSALVAVVTVGIDDSPEETVTDYLNTIRSRDVDEALSYTRHLGRVEGFSNALLVPEVLTTHWHISQITPRFVQADDKALVDIAITAADGTRGEGCFSLERRAGRWVILNPLVRLDLSTLPFSYVEVNGLTRQVTVVWLFPGAYHLYQGVADFVTLSAPPTWPSPPPATPHRTPAHSFSPLFSITEEGEERARMDFEQWLTTCASSRSPSPPNCPFTAAFQDEIRIGSDPYEADRVTWRIVTVPAIELQPQRGFFSVVPQEIGEVQVSGRGLPLYARDDTPQDFTGICEISLSSTFVSLNSDREFEFTTNPVHRTRYPQ